LAEIVYQSVFLLVYTVYLLRSIRCRFSRRKFGKTWANWKLWGGGNSPPWDA